MSLALGRGSEGLRFPVGRRLGLGRLFVVGVEGGVRERVRRLAADLGGRAVEREERGPHRPAFGDGAEPGAGKRLVLRRPS